MGVQRWDMYSGNGATQEQELGYLPGAPGFLKASEWHDRAPFFCRLTKDVEWVQHPANAGPLWCNYPFSQEYLQQAMDQEICYAYNAGIDFFIYHGPARKIVANAWELKNNLDAQMASARPEAKMMGFVWALYGHKAMQYTRGKVEAMMDETIEYIKMPNWQKVMGARPLVLVLWPENFKEQLAAAKGDQKMTGREFTDYIRNRVKATGLTNPYIVGMIVPARSFEHAQELKKDGYDAFTDYDGSYGGTTSERDKSPTYAEATKTLNDTYEKQFLNRGLPFIPPCTSMQYPWPRAIDEKTGKPKKQWYHYQWPRKGDLTARVTATLDFVAAHPTECEAQTFFMYSWNEHSEGGGICPTMGKPPRYEPDTRWLDEVAKALSAWTNKKKPDCLATAVYSSEAQRPYGLVGLRLLPHDSVQAKAGWLAGIGNYADLEGQYPFVAENLDVVWGPRGCFKTDKSFFEWYLEDDGGAEVNPDPKTSKLVDYIRRAEQAGMNHALQFASPTNIVKTSSQVVQYILICRETGLTGRGKPGPFKQDYRILYPEDVAALRKLFRDAHASGLLKQDNYKLIQMVEHPCFFAEDPEAQKIIKSMDGVVYEAHQFGRHWPLETGCSRPEPVVRGAKWTLDQGKDYIFYYGPFRFRESGKHSSMTLTPSILVMTGASSTA